MRRGQAVLLCILVSVGVGVPAYLVQVREPAPGPVRAGPAVQTRSTEAPRPAVTDAELSSAPRETPTSTGLLSAQAPDLARAAAGPGWTVSEVIDGDTVDVVRSGRTERVRIIGIDTPEQGECGFDDAARALALLAAGQTVTLETAAQARRDEYDRLLSYVDLQADGTDVGLALIFDGFAVARYDSLDGYGAHPRESAYRAADERSQPVLSCPTAPDEPSTPSEVPVPSGPDRSGCDPSYPGVCIPPAPPDLDCPQVPYQSFVVLGPDPHRFDGNGDGLGCEPP